MSELALQLIRKEKEEQTGYLDIGRCGLTELPEELFELTWLETLIVSNQWINWKIDKIGSSKNSGKDNFFSTNIQLDLSKLSKLRKLYFGGFFRKKWKLAAGVNLANLDKLQILNLDFNQITNISFLEGLTQLQRLYLRYNQITNISFLQCLTQLQRLDLRSNQITDISFLQCLTQLQRLDLRSNQITDISFLQGLTQLQRLDLSSNQITDYSFLEGLTQLQRLDLSSNQIMDYSFLEGLTQLQRLDLSSNQIMDISFLQGLTQLQTLDLRDNQITDISFLEGLTQLQTLDLRANQITDISFLQGLMQLQTLDLSANQITDISFLLPFFRKGLVITLDRFDFAEKRIRLYGNPIESPPLEIVKQGNEAILTYYKSLKKGKVVALNEIKIMLMGEGMAGKTSLLKQLKGLPFDQRESQTHGINIESLELTQLPPFKQYADLSATTGHFWDFGGQEIMHASHQFFMTQRAIYILLIDSRTDAKKEYWLQHIEKYGGDNSPLFVVMNKIDENETYNIEQRSLNQKYPLIGNRFFRISCKTEKGIANLIEKIAQEIPKTELFGTEVREDWVQVKEVLETATDEQNYLDETSFKEICVKHKVTDSAEQQTLLNFLHQLGIVLHFEKLELKNFYVLDPHWLTVGVYNIINSHAIPDGMLLETDLDYILNEEEIKKEEYDPAKTREFIYNSQEQAYLIKVMQQFELLYEFAEGKYLIPDLLPKEPIDEVAFDLQGTEHIHFIFAYDFLPNSIMARFIIRMRQDIKNLKQLWRTGVVLYNEQFAATAYVNADKEDKRISICVVGDSMQKREYFSVIRHTLWGINNEFQFKKGDIKQLIPVPEYPQIEVDYEELLGYERANKDDYFVGKLGKEFSVSKDFLDKVVSRSERMKEQKRQKQITQHINIYGGQQNVSGQTTSQQIQPPPVPLPSSDTNITTKPKQWYEKWIVTCIVVGIVTVLLSWWLSQSLKMGVIAGIIATAVMLFNNPDRWLIRMAQGALAAFVGTLYLNFNLAFQHRTENGNLDIQLSDPPIILSLSLLVFAAICVIVEKRSQKK